MTPQQQDGAEAQARLAVQQAIETYKRLIAQRPPPSPPTRPRLKAMPISTPRPKGARGEGTGEVYA